MDQELIIDLSSLFVSRQHDSTRNGAVTAREGEWVSAHAGKHLGFNNGGVRGKTEEGSSLFSAEPWVGVWECVTEDEGEGGRETWLCSLWWRASPEAQRFKANLWLWKQKAISYSGARKPLNVKLFSMEWLSLFFAHCVLDRSSSRLRKVNQMSSSEAF